MNTLNVPIGFENIQAMNKWYSQFEAKAMEICKRHGVSEYWTTVQIFRDQVNLQISITSMGAYIAKSKTERAANEILEAFEAMF